MADKNSTYLHKTSHLLSKDRLNKVQNDDDDGGSGGSGKKKGHSFRDVNKAIEKGNLKAEAVAGFLRKHEGTDHQSVGDKALGRFHTKSSASSSAKSGQANTQSQAQSKGGKQQSTSIAKSSFLNSSKSQSIQVSNPNSAAGKQANASKALFMGSSVHGASHGNPLGIGKQSGSNESGNVIGTRPTGMGRASR